MYDGSMVSRESNEEDLSNEMGSIAFWFYLDDSASLPQTLLTRHMGSTTRTNTIVVLTITATDKIECKFNE